MSPRPRSPERSAFAAELDRARRGDRDGAVRSIRGSLAGDAGVPERTAAALALAEIARLAEGEADPAGAERALAAALELRPEFADLHLRHARLLGRMGDRNAARAAVDRALAREPRYLAARLERAMLDAREGRVGEALDALRVLQEEFPAREPRAMAQGIRSLERADWEDAESLLRRALRVEDPEFDAALARARRDLEEDRPAEARTRICGLLAAHPAYPDLHALLGSAELALGHVDDAVASLGKALELQPEFLEARARFAQALEAMGDFAAAAEQAALVLEREPGHVAAMEIERRWAGRRGRRSRLTAS